jgi:uncharacterized protein
VHVAFTIEEHDKDKSVAALRVNQKMKQGADIVRKQDPRAILKTRGYYTYPVYAEEQLRQNSKIRQLASWRVSEALEVTTVDLDSLPAMVAGVQQVLTVNGLYFGLTDAAARKLDEKRVEATTYRNLTEHIASMPRRWDVIRPMRYWIPLILRGGCVRSGQTAVVPKAMRAAAEAVLVEEPSFEPGETFCRCAPSQK